MEKNSINQIEVDVIIEYHNKKEIPLTRESIMKFIEKYAKDIRDIINQGEREPNKIIHLLPNKEN